VRYFEASATASAHAAGFLSPWPTSRAGEANGRSETYFTKPVSATDRQRNLLRPARVFLSVSSRCPPKRCESLIKFYITPDDVDTLAFRQRIAQAEGYLPRRVLFLLRSPWLLTTTQPPNASLPRRSWSAALHQSSSTKGNTCQADPALAILLANCVLVSGAQESQVATPPPRIVGDRRVANW